MTPSHVTLISTGLVVNDNMIETVSTAALADKLWLPACQHTMVCYGSSDRVQRPISNTFRKWFQTSRRRVPHDSLPPLYTAMTRSSSLEEWLTWSFSPTISAIVVTLLVSLTIPILIHLYLYRKAASKGTPTVLLVGPGGAGKTSLLTLVCSSFLCPPLLIRNKLTHFRQLSTGHSLPTHTSQSPTTTPCQLPSSTRSSADKYRSQHDNSANSRPEFLIIDTPGHGKLRHHALSALAATNPRLIGIIYVVDSAAVSSASGLTETAEYLHDVLLLLQKQQTQSQTSKNPAPISVLVAANKQDLFTSLPVALVRKKLEEEIGKVRVTKSKGVLDSSMRGEGEEDEEAAWLGEYGVKHFTFQQVEEYGIDVKVLGGSIESDGQQKVGEWLGWLGELL
nr:signal recognition particle receptor subunit beta [Quercus suber]